MFGVSGYGCWRLCAWWHQRGRNEENLKEEDDEKGKIGEKRKGKQTLSIVTASLLLAFTNLGC